MKPSSLTKENKLRHTLGGPSEHSKVPPKTDLQNKLARDSIRVKKLDAKAYDDKAAISEESSAGLQTDDDQKPELMPMTATKAKKEFRTHFDDINERI